MAKYEFFDQEIDIWKGTIQKPKPTLETYTMLGNDKLYVQKLQTESKPSQLQLFKFVDVFEQAYELIDKLNEKVGKRGDIKFEGDIDLKNVLLLDMDYTIKRATVNLMRVLLTLNVTILTDNKEA